MADADSVVLAERDGDLTIVRFTSDEIRDHTDSRQVSQDLKSLAINVGGRMILSLRNVRYISSSGIAALILFNRLLRTVRGDLKVCDIQPLVLNALVTAGADQVLDIYPTQEDAAAALGASP